ncbi:hypothetical protein [Flavobacterium sp. GT3R68]|uniref:hypothetical protein n=1 Tax=Flavobacterium sp. GT3R68 TaxID=2594437 RepID=UPI000F87EEC4|nr:hypothetical protein [Flavobacterium sp. GT3R68]RTY95147.1 hypothetical protein EKL32_06860 [Flavobacterium sp. GSN2]TRW91111.1 hypothetical protein FNW07_09805 [Flavobacterium sp. GT3R68]
MSETNFRDLWQSQKINADSNAEAIVTKAKQLQKKTRLQIILGNLLLFVTMLFIIGIAIYFKPQMITSKIGIILVLAAIIMQITASSKLIVWNKSNAQKSNLDYLQQLVLFKKKQAFLQSTIMNIYFVLLGLGIVLYMIEYTIRMSTFAAIMTYGVTLAWIALNWFYLRPKIINKQQQKLNEVISNLESINEQFLKEN